jgi:nicotinate-nucleotide pyrophosphorylase (carboxylating)
MGLYDMVMIKDNHLAALGGDIAAAVDKARRHAPGIPVAIEVENLDQLHAALTARVGRIMLDNMKVETMREAVEIADGGAVIEATGGVTADTIVQIAETGVDFISVGAITHSAPVLDIGLDFA